MCFLGISRSCIVTNCQLLVIVPECIYILYLVEVDRYSLFKADIIVMIVWSKK